MNPEKLPKGHVLDPKDSMRVRCQHTGCSEHAVACEYRRWSSPSPGVAFDYFCEKCWYTLGPDGESPYTRTGIAP